MIKKLRKNIDRKQKNQILKLKNLKFYIIKNLIINRY